MQDQEFKDGLMQATKEGRLRWIPGSNKTTRYLYYMISILDFSLVLWVETKNLHIKQAGSLKLLKEVTHCYELLGEVQAQDRAQVEDYYKQILDSIPAGNEP